MLELSSLSDKLIVRQDGGMMTFQYSFNEPQVAHPGPAECHRNRLDTIDLVAWDRPSGMGQSWSLHVRDSGPSHPAEVPKTKHPSLIFRILVFK